MKLIKTTYARFILSPCFYHGEYIEIMNTKQK